MVDVLLTHSYHLYWDRKQVRKMQPYPPLGTLYAASLLRQRGFSVALFDSMLQEPEAGFRAAIAETRPKVVAIYEDSFNFLSKMCLSRMREIAFGMIRVSREYGAKIVVNGSDPSDHCAEYLESGGDFVLLGEAEWTLLELVESLMGRSDKPIDQIPGLAYRTGSNAVLRTPVRPLMTNLDHLPLPARDLVEMDTYRDAWTGAHGFFSLNLVASRGCPYRCNWCAKPIYGDFFHARAPECVASEMRELRERYGAGHLWFADDIFGISDRWVQEFARSVERYDAAVPFKMQSRVDLMKEETVHALRRAGCVEIWMGVESGSQKILDAMDKGTTISGIFQARENLSQNGIRACFFIQFGYPGETWRDIQKTIQLVRQTKPDDIGVSVSYPLPGTKFFESVRGELGTKTNWVDSGDLSMMFKGAYRSEFYQALHDALHAEVDSWSPEAPRFSPREIREASDQCSRTRLWDKVAQLERTCRNADATRLPALPCDDAVAVAKGTV